MKSFEVICLNDSARPDGIPSNKWVKKGQKYNVIEVKKMLIQGGKLGFKLEEINIDDCFPYQYFSADRFGVVITDKMWAEAELARLLKEAQIETEHSKKPELA